MVAGTPDSTVQHPHASSSTPVPSAEEEALKRNTDCVYFLASPLTCKKGAECEYRHSDYARVNPRDCWYWLNGNCLNPKCAFRHPPLDGLLGTQATTASVAGPVGPPQVAVPVAPPLPTYSAGKQVVPCIFFQKGYCMKGDRCAFSHGTNPVGNKVQQTPAQTLPGELPSLKKPAGGLERCSQEQKIAPNLSKPTALQLAPKLVPEAEKNLPVNVGRIDRNAPLARSTDEEASQYKHLNSSAVKGSLQTRPGRSHQAHAPDDRNFQHDKENEELMRESSPGFDVLVDDELGDADYYHGEDHQYGRTRTHEQYEMDHLTDYNSLSDIDRRDSRGYDRMIGWDQRRNSSERMLAYPEGRSYQKSESPDHIDESDLRHRLSKQRRVNGLRSVVSNDFASESLVDDRMYHSSSRQRLPSQESSLGGRLKGRIKFPGRSTVNGSDGHQQHRDRDMDRGRSQGRSYQDRPRDNNSRLKGRVQEHFTSEERSVSGPRMRREFLDGNSGEFARPKRLTELKSSNREPQVRGQAALGKQQTPISFADQQAETDVSFEGPKPLSVLLKRKREVVTAATEESRPEYDSDSLITSGKDAAGKVELHGSSSPSKEEEEKGERAPDHVNQSKKEDGMMVEVEEGAVDEHEIEGDYQRDGDYEYEQVDEEGEYNYDGENADEEEYIDDEEGDDFAKKVGVMFS